MIRLALRLSVAGGREALTRLVSIAVAVALGSGMLLACVAGVQAVNTQNDRYGWLNAGVVPAAATGDPLWFRLSNDYHDGASIGRIDVAATGPAPAVPPGMPRLPGPGEYFASPALADLLDATPAAQLGDRYPGRRTGIVGDAALPSPDSLLVVIGQTPAQVSALPDARQVTSFPASLPARCDGCVSSIQAAGLILVLGVVAAALLFPVLMFIGAATRLSATRREQRFAAMRLVGATPRQVSLIAAAEALVSAVAGTAAGFVLFAAFRVPLAAIPFSGTAFFPADFVPGLWPAVLVALGIPAAAAVAAWLALRRVRISPLGVSRGRRRNPPGAWRLVPLLLGLGELLYFIGRRPNTSQGQLYAFLPGFLIIMAGLVVAGPWLTMTGARLIARLARRPAGLIAARRLADDPRSAFRSVSGLVLALFVTTVAVGVIGSIADHRNPATAAHTRVLSSTFRDLGDPGLTVPDGIAGLPGVTGVAVVREPPPETPPPATFTGEWPPFNLAACTDVARSPEFGRCPAGAEVAWVWQDFQSPFQTADSEWPAADMTLAQLATYPVRSIVVGTDGSAAAVETARTRLEAAFPQRWAPSTLAENNAETNALFNGWKRLADVVVVISLIIAGCSLTAGVAGGLSDRKRPFSMLRLAGTPLRLLQRVVALESGVPLLAAAAVAVAAGLGAAHLFLTAQMEYGLLVPGVAYWLIVVAGLAASLGIIASTLPLLRRMTGPAAARNE